MEKERERKERGDRFMVLLQGINVVERERKDRRRKNNPWIKSNAFLKSEEIEIVGA
jgi:hypothetical protein